MHQAPFPALQGDVSCVVAVVRLDEGPQLMANLLEVDVERLTIGLRLRVVFEDRGAGRRVPQFVTAEP